MQPRLLLLLVAASFLVRATTETVKGDEPSGNNDYANSGYAETEQPDAFKPKTRATLQSSNYSQRPTSEYYVKSSRQRGYQPRYSTADGSSYRQPVAIQFVTSERALISTKLTGQIYEFDLADNTLREIYRDPDCSWGAILHLDPQTVAIADSNRNRLVLFSVDDAGDWQRGCELSAAGNPHALAWDALSKTLYASATWAQRLYRWKLRNGHATQRDSWEELASTDLNMCGGELLLLPQHDAMMVADAFGRHYCIVDCSSGELIKHDQVYGHNIGNLVAVTSTSGQSEDKLFDMVVFPHQLLNEYVQAERGDITWGGMISNNLRWLRVDRLLKHTGAEIFKQGRFYPVGTTGNGSGDPNCLRISSSGLMAITLGGTNRVAIGNDDDYYFQQLDVGLHPVDCQFSPDERKLIVVNQFSDSLSIISLDDLEHAPIEHVSLGELRAPTQLERGEQAFFDSRLSHDGWMSCHSCHSQGHTNGQLNDNMSDHSFGTPKRVLSLLGQAKTMPYSWGGGVSSLEVQVANSLTSTMASDFEVPQETIEDIAAYVRSLPPPPSLHAARGGNHHVQDPKHPGRQLFRQLGCNECHRGRWLTQPASFDVGFEDQNGMRQFNPPSLRGVSQRQGALFHDARATSIRDVLETHQHQLPRQLDSQELQMLVEYLESL